MLLDEGADKGLVDLQGMTAKDHAKEKECVTIIGIKDSVPHRFHMRTVLLRPFIFKILVLTMACLLWYSTLNPKGQPPPLPTKILPN